MPLLLALFLLADTATGAEVAIIDSTTLAAFDDTELSEILEHAGTCGRIVLVGVSPEVVDVFLNRAGCGGQYFASATDANEAAMTAQRLAARPPPPGASHDQLRELLEAQQANHYPAIIVTFLAGYAGLLSILLISKTTRWVALGFSIVATTLAYIAWPPATERTFLAWAEAELHWRVATFNSLERIRSYRDGAFTIEDTFTRGSFPLQPVIGYWPSSGDVTVCNKGKKSLTELHVRWREALYAIAELAPGAQWTSRDALPVAPDRAELALFVERSAGYDLTVFRPLPQDDTYLLQRGLPEDGAGACEQ